MTPEAHSLLRSSKNSSDPMIPAEWHRTYLSGPYPYLQIRPATPVLVTDDLLDNGVVGLGGKGLRRLVSVYNFGRGPV